MSGEILQRHRRRHPILTIGLILVMESAVYAMGQTHPDFRLIGARDINQGAFGLPGRLTQAEEEEQGAAIDALLRDQIVVSNEPEITAYLRQLAEAISARSDFTGPIRVVLARNQKHLAFATVAGYLYVDEELFKAVECESELAGVLAHEIAHLAARHGSENVLRSRLLKERPRRINALLGPLTDVAPPEIKGDVAAFWRAVRFTNEIEADELATQYLWNTGFDPEGLLNFLGRVTDEDRLEPHPGIHRPDSHPPLNLRREKIRRVLETLPALETTRPDSSDFDAARDRLRSR